MLRVGKDAKFYAEGRKVPLITDNCTTHPNIDNFKAIELVILPPNTISKTKGPGSKTGIKGFLSHGCCQASDQIH